MQLQIKSDVLLFVYYSFTSILKFFLMWNQYCWNIYRVVQQSYDSYLITQSLYSLHLYKHWSTAKQKLKQWSSEQIYFNASCTGKKHCYHQLSPWSCTWKIKASSVVGFTFGSLQVHPSTNIHNLYKRTTMETWSIRVHPSRRHSNIMVVTSSHLPRLVLIMNSFEFPNM